MMLDVDLIHGAADGEPEEPVPEWNRSAGGDRGRSISSGPGNSPSRQGLRASFAARAPQLSEDGLRPQAMVAGEPLRAGSKEHAAGLGIAWGWKQDPATINYPWVLYVDLPTGQVSYHSQFRGEGPDYPATGTGSGEPARNG